MSSTKSIKQRIKSVKNTSQITKAMEVVSATKMRRSQQFAIAARPFAVASLELMQNLLRRTPQLPPLLKTRAVKIKALLVVTSDKGLAGAFNANVLRKADAWIADARATGTVFSVITVGKKAKEYYERTNAAVAQSFWKFGDYTDLSETLPIADLILEGFRNKQWDSVEAVYTHFRTTLFQETSLKRILPASEDSITEAVRAILPEHGRYAFQARTDADSTRTNANNISRKSAYVYEYAFEPSSTQILEALVPQLIKMHIHHIILESNASEHSARMVAMKSASDNARELIDDLTLEFNKARQANITRELVEITAGTEALEH
ncbi:MAG: ATP synthase F1 subunit gamma [Candidatus Sungbacteria bacterium]|nr:ATP synthase F1 subunit gamma [Candidatus Sungbacteria bacterium]